MSEIKRGQKVKYVPSAAHWNDRFPVPGGKQTCFHFHYEHRGHPKDGEKVEEAIMAEAGLRLEPSPDGKPCLSLGDHSKHEGLPTRIRVGEPRLHWDAEIIGVAPDGSVEVRAKHPDPGQGTRDYPSVVVAADLEPKPLGSCYVVREEKKSDSQGTRKPVDSPSSA